MSITFHDAESAPLAGIAALAERHAALGAELAAKREEAASLRVVAELQERLAAFDAQVAAGARSGCRVFPQIRGVRES